MKRHVLFVHGGGEGAYEADSRLAESLRRELGEGWEVRAPRMPGEDSPDYEVWAEVIADELARMEGPVALVGHSVGGTVLARLLGDQGVDHALSGLFLVATPFVGPGGWESEEGGVREDLGVRLPAGMPVFLYHSRDDETAPFEHMALYAERVPGARQRALEGRGHQLGDDLSEVARDLEGL